ncbi:MAG: endolytic transglycosylase MltG, partial [Spirochaetaceae bacterium]|nr:endolytic transglycosylase MltG [Spirochaetaceae bacterium]
MRAAKIRKIHVIFIFFPVFLVISVIFLTAIFFFLNEPPPEHGVSTENVAVDSEKKEVLMELREGESASSIGARLEAAHLIKTQYLWNILCRIDRDYLKAGNYQFAEGLRLTEIHDIFVNGKQMLVSVTIPEGSTIKKTAAILEKAGICSARDFIESAQNKSLLDEYRIPGKTMEGYLSPDTYYFPVRYPATQAVRAMAETFYKKLHDLGIGQESALELHNQVILASIIEREYRIDEEAPVMAGVFQNRMKIGMRLESCASIEYI